MSLIIDKSTPEGEAKLEALKWAEKEFNRVVKTVIGEGILTRGFMIKFKFPEDIDEKGKPIQITVTNDEPRTKEVFNKVLDLVREKLGFVEHKEVVVGEIVDEKK